MIYGIRFSSRDSAHFVKVGKGDKARDGGKARVRFNQARARLAMTCNRAIALVAISETGQDIMTLDRAAS